MLYVQTRMKHHWNKIYKFANKILNLQQKMLETVHDLLQCDEMNCMLTIQKRF